MYTKDIILEEVTGTEFEQMKQYWGREGLRLNDDDRKSRVYRPFTWPLLLKDRVEDYFQFLQSLFRHPFLTQIAVHNRHQWERHHASDLKKDWRMLERIAELAATDRWKKYYLEVKFSTKRGHFETVRKATLELAELRFGEQDCRIVGFQTIVPYLYREWFTIAGEDKKYQINHGLWVPEEGMSVRVNTD